MTLRRWFKAIAVVFTLAVLIGTLVAYDRYEHMRLMRELGYNGPRNRWFSGYFARLITDSLSRAEVQARMRGYDTVLYYRVPLEGGDSGVAERYVFGLPLGALHVNVFYRAGRVFGADPNDYGTANARELTSSEAARLFEQ